MGRPAKPQLPAQPGGIAGARVRGWRSGDGFGGVNGEPADHPGVGVLRSHRQLGLPLYLVCRLLLEKKKPRPIKNWPPCSFFLVRAAFLRRTITLTPLIYVDIT